MRILKIALLAGLLPLTQLSAESVVPILNNGFEEGKKAWTDDKGTAQVTKEAANKGQGGLRVVDTDETDYIRVVSEPVKITPEKTYRLDCMVNQVSGHGTNAILWFLDQDQKIIPWPDGGRLLIRPADGVTGWENLSVEGRAPAGAVYAQVHVQSNRIAIATVDWDEFTLKQLD